MPWCPVCRTEYVKGYERCTDCGATLVPSLPVENGSAGSRHKAGEEDQEAFLVSVTTDMEANVIISLLKAYHIPVMKKYLEAGQVLAAVMGASSMGLDLYVPSRALVAARDILAAPSETNEPWLTTESEEL